MHRQMDYHTTTTSTVAGELGDTYHHSFVRS